MKITKLKIENSVSIRVAPTAFCIIPPIPADWHFPCLVSSPARSETEAKRPSRPYILQPLSDLRQRHLRRFFAVRTRRFFVKAPSPVRHSLDLRRRRTEPREHLLLRAKRAPLSPPCGSTPQNLLSSCGRISFLRLPRETALHRRLRRISRGESALSEERRDRMKCNLRPVSPAPYRQTLSRRPQKSFPRRDRSRT